jgi:hypothetical protein
MNPQRSPEMPRIAKQMLRGTGAAPKDLGYRA